MRIKWEELQQDNEAALEKTIRSCQQLIQKQEHCFVSKKMALRQYACLELKRIRTVYSLFLACLFIFIIFSSHIKIGIVMLYYLLLGSYFLYQLYEFRNGQIAELMLSMPINEGKRFVLLMCSFLLVHFISFISFAIIGYLRVNIGLLEVIQLALIPLFAAHGCMLLVMHRMQNFHTVILCYTVLFLFFCDFFHPMLRNDLYMRFDFWQTSLLCIAATLLFLIASWHYGKILRRRHSYGA